jgi:DHA2 family multidrug resistance protein
MTAIPSESESLPLFRQVMLLISLSVGTLIYGMALTMGNVLLPQIQGALSATHDQIAWVVTFHLVAVAVATPLTGWLAGLVGRKRFMTGTIVGFVISTVLCGASDSLMELVIWRITQGLFGAPLMPLVQAIILDIYPRRNHALVTMLWGLVAVSGPFTGAIFGGYVGELINWRWAFYLVAPIGIVAWVGCQIFLSEGWRGRTRHMDWIGFLSLVIAIGSFQLMLDRGSRLDWFDSTEIIIEAIIAGLALYIFFIHCLTGQRPFINLRLLLNQNFSLGLIFAFIFGALYLTPMVLYPTLLQDLRDFPESIIGLLLSARAVGNWASFLIIVQLTHFSPRLAILLGFLCQLGGGLWMANLNINLTVWDVIWTNALQGFGTGVIYVPMTIIAFSNLSSRDFAEGSALFHLLRNMGSAIFISISVTLVVTSGNVGYAGLTEIANSFNELLRYSGLVGAWNADNSRSLIVLSGEMQRQATMIGYLNAFQLFNILACVALPLVLLVKIGGETGIRQ